MKRRAAIAATVVAGLLAVTSGLVLPSDSDDATFEDFLALARGGGEMIDPDSLTDRDVSNVQACLDRLNAMTEEELLDPSFGTGMIYISTGKLRIVQMCADRTTTYGQPVENP